MKLCPRCGHTKHNIVCGHTVTAMVKHVAYPDFPGDKGWSEVKWIDTPCNCIVDNKQERKRIRRLAEANYQTIMLKQQVNTTHKAKKEVSS